MMVNNKLIKSLTKKILKNNRMRNLFVIIAIVLTTILFTVIFTSGASLIKGFQNQLARQAGNIAHGTISGLTLEQYDSISKHSSVKSIGKTIYLAPAINESLIKRNTIMRYGSDTEAFLSLAIPNIGNMPINKNEIATDTIVLDALGIPHEIGKMVRLEFYINNQLYVKDFILSGIYEGDILTNTSNVWVSMDLLYELESENELNITDKVNAKIMFNNSMNINRKLVKLIGDLSYPFDETKYSANFIYQNITGGGFDFNTIASGLLLFFVIIFTGYLVIYNIFNISITKDIRFYGMLKTIGTTPTQIKRIVKSQMFRLAIIGIPIGLILGFIMGILLMPTIIASINLDKSIVSFNPIIFIGSALFALFTIYLGSRKPAKIASKITPVEALKYQNSFVKKSYRKTSNAKIYKIALNNLLRDKKKTIIIVTTMFLSLIILNTAYSISKAGSVEKFIEFMIPSDYVVASVNYFDYRFDENYDYVSDELIEKIDSSDMVENSSKIYMTVIDHDLSDEALKKYKDFYENKELDDYMIDAILRYTNRELEIPLSTYGLNKYSVEKLELKVGQIDINKFATGEYIILCALSTTSTQSLYEIGDTVILKINDEIKSYEVMAIASLPYSMSVKFYRPGSIDCILPDTEFIDLFENPSTMSYIFDVKSDKEDKMEELLKDYTTIDDVTMEYESRQTLSKEFEDTSKMFIVVGGMLSFIIGLISIANFINSIFASIITRKTELAMMKSIGMTSKQVRRMLEFEGLYYGGLSVLLALIIEIGFRNFLARAFTGGMWAFDNEFTILPLLIAAPILLAISLLIPYFANKRASKISLVEQLRAIE